MELLFLATFGEVMEYIGYILLAILILLVMITIHEFGHYIAGKIFGFGIEEFSIGFGPKLFSRKKKDGEIFSVRFFPLGGFCSFKGEDEDVADERAFNNKKPWKRIIVLVSGALMNYVLSVIVIIIMFGAYGQTAFMVGKIVPSEIYANHTLIEKDVILEVEGKSIYLTTDIMSAIRGKKEGERVSVLVIRKGQKQLENVTLRADASFKNVEDVKVLYDAFGITYAMDSGGVVEGVELYSTNVRLGFFETIGKSFEYSFRLAGTVFTVLGQLLTGKLSIGAMGGTITTITMTAEAISIGGFRYFLQMASFIGVNLAVFNLLPFPALDGARVVFCIIESIRKKPVSRRVEGIVHTVGFVLLILFAVFVDLQRCF